MTPKDEMEELSQLIQAPLTAGTVNRGSNVIAAGNEVEYCVQNCHVDSFLSRLIVAFRLSCE